MKKYMKCKNIEFIKIGKAQVSFHPNPKGVIQFLGGYFFGTFPTYFYSNFLAGLKSHGYTIVVFAYTLSSDHLKVAQTLYESYKKTKEELKNICSSDFYKEDKNYSWVAHSLGCEYIALLNLLSNNDKKEKNEQHDINSAMNNVCRIFKEINEDAVKRIFELSLELKNTLSPIGEQASVFIAPCFRPPTPLLQCIIKPTQEQMWDCIEEKKDTSFNLTSVISFTKDCTAGSGTQCQECTFDIATKNSQKCSDVCFLVEKLKLKDRDLWLELDGNHMTPIYMNNQINLAESIVNFLNKQKSIAN
jgi:hypothetical protein